MQCFDVSIDVSIPERVLGWLKRVCTSLDPRPQQVSIPERVLGWLKLSAPDLTPVTDLSFNP